MKTSLNYTSYKQRQLSRLRIGWVAGCLLVAASVVVVADRYVPDDLWTLLGGLTEPGQKAQDAARKIDLGDLTSRFFLAGVVLGPLCVVVWTARSKVATWAFDHFLDRFHDQLFLPVQRPRASVEKWLPLPWIAPSRDNSSRARHALWTALHDWVRQGADLEGSDARAFSWALLVGRSGGGKSRMADEFARSLGRRDVLGDHARSNATRAQRWAAHRLSVGAALRRARRKPAATDPWDAGRPAHRRDSETALMQNADHFKELLKHWQPRAPTLIVFEDPRAEEAAHLISWLVARTAPSGGEHTEPAYRFPVRLLIVNQTMPADLKLVPDPSLQRSAKPGLRSLLAPCTGTPRPLLSHSRPARQAYSATSKACGTLKGRWSRWQARVLSAWPGRMPPMSTARSSSPRRPRRARARSPTSPRRSRCWRRPSGACSPSG